MNLTTAIEQFCVEQICRGNSPTTVCGYRHFLGYFRDFAGDLSVNKINLDLLHRYFLSLKDKGLCSISIQSYIRHLRAFLNWLYNSDLIKTDLCHKFRLPKAKKPAIDVLTDSEISSLFDSFLGDDFLPVRNRAILALYLDTGLRLSELVSIRRSTIHIQERYAIVDGKGDKQRVVAFGNETRDYLFRYLSMVPDSPFLFLSSREVDGVLCPLSVSAVKMLFRRLKRAVPRVHAHLLRHSFATRFVENGGDLAQLQILMGHSSIKQTEVYLHLAQRLIQEKYINFSPFDRFSSEKEHK